MKRAERFEVLETIQEGQVATSYRARDRVLERTVLLKVLHPRSAGDKDMVERFRREAMLQARLKHPNIVTVYDFGSEEDMYIASEFIEGRTLQSMIEQEKRLPAARLAPLVLEVARALEYAHRNGVVHRDLKPANIMVDSHGAAKLTDFGLAFARDYGELTQEGCVVGTPAYMSPEQARGRRTDLRTDVFSLGIVIYQALSGTNPFAAETFADAMTLVLNREPKPLRQLVPEAGPELETLVRRMLAKDPAARPNGMDEIISLFSAMPGAAAARRRPFAPAAVWVAVAALAVVVAVLALGRRPPAPGIAAPADTTPVTAAESSKPDVRVPVETAGVVGESSKSETQDPKREAAARLRLNVLPWAQVAIDGRPVGATPFDGPLELARGPHTIEFTHPDYPLLRKRVDIADSVASLTIDLSREFAFADIRVTPWGAIAVDNQPTDTTPLARPIPLTLGEHILTISHPTLGTRVEHVKTDSAKVYRFDFTLGNR